MSEYHVPWYLYLLRRFLRFVFRGIFRFFYRIRITGLENVPASGAYIIAQNHVSMIDPPFLISFWPISIEAIASSHLWEKRALSILPSLYRGLPVNRGKFDREVMEKTIQILRSGYPLLIAPEGTRSHEPGLLPALPGVAYLVDKGQAPVVPVAIMGSQIDEFEKARRMKRPLLEMKIGKPFTVPAISGRGRARRDSRQRNADLIMHHLAELLPIEYRGVYAERKDEHSTQAAQ